MASKVNVKRSVAKAITWRIIGTIDTTILTWIVTGNPLAGLKVGFLETVFKLLLYYFHERAWYHYHFKELEKHKQEITKKRHLLKTVTWRILGTISTMTLAWFVTDSLTVGFEVAGLELITKTALYYFHERVWYKYDFGLQEKNKNKKHE